MPDSNSKRSASKNPEVPPTEIREDHVLEMGFSINNRNIQELMSGELI